MVYASPLDLSTDDNDNITYTAMGDPHVRNKPVRIFYNNKALDEIAGPVPLVDLSKTYNRTEGGVLQSITTKINLSGKVIRSTYYDPNVSPSGTGTAILLKAIQELDNLFKCNNGVFEIRCGSTAVLSASGVKINSYSANKSSDNWIMSSDYAVDLEFSEPATSGGPLIKNGSDSWSLEPLEEYVYTNWQIGAKSKAEYDNPLLSPTAGSSSSNSTPVRVPASDGGIEQLSIVTVPQFKLSRKISAVGIPNVSPTGSCSSGNYTAYQNAQKWVKDRLAEAFGGNTGASGLPVFSNSAISSLGGFSNIFLYNHLRTTNFDHLAGSYEVNETWLAMPTGIKYIEDYTIESQTDDRYIKTVRVQGTIKGLLTEALPIMSGGSGLVPDNSGIISLSYAQTSGTSGSLSSYKIQDKYADNSKDQNLYGNKYQNALSGWLNDVKPYLYRRASIGLNSADRTKSYITTGTNPPPAPNNPSYSYENLLNIIPVSTTEGHDPRKGSISYTYEFNNRTRFFSGVLAETVSISDTGPTEIINQAFVLGRRLGPILQSLGTRTNATKSVTIDIVVLPPSSIKGFIMTEQECPVWTGGSVYSGINSLIEGLRPFGARQGDVFANMTRSRIEGQTYVTRDDQSWNPTEGRYTRNVDWVYQTCNLSRFYLDH